MPKFVSIFLITLLVIISVPSVAFAQSKSAKTIIIDHDQTLNQDYFGAGDVVTVSGTINGDAYIAGGTVLVDGTVTGDLLVAGGNVTINGVVNQDLRVAGGTVHIGGQVDGNTTAAGGSVIVANSAIIKGSLVLGAGKAQVLAPVAKNITAGVGELTVDNGVKGDVTAGVGELFLTPAASISGNLKYWSSDEAKFQSGATVSGQTIYSKLPANQDGRENLRNFSRGLWTTFKIMGFASSLLLGLLLIYLARSYVVILSNTVITRPGASALFGLMTLIAFPVVIILLMFSVIGLPLAMILSCLFIISLFMTKIVVSFALGHVLTKALSQPKTSLYLSFLLGLIVYEVLTLIPFVGGLISFIGLIMGIGSLVLAKKYFYTIAKDKKLL